MSRNKFTKRLTMLSTAICLGLCSSAFAQTVSMDLPDAMQRAFNTNPAINIAGYELESAKASYDAARESRGISITGTHRTQRGGSNHAIATNYYDASGNRIYTKGIGNGNTNALTASLPLYTGGKLSGTIKQAKAGYISAIAEKQQAYNEMRSTVTNGYFKVLQTDNLQKLGQEAVDRLSDHLKNVKAQYDVGVVAKVDVLRSEVELTDAKQSLIQYKNNYELAVASMDKVVGLPLSTQLQLQNILVYTPYDKDLQYCLDYAASHRPELEEAKQGVEAARGALLVARSGYQPQVSASASQDWSKDRGIGTNADDWGVGFGVSWNIFDSGVTFSKIHGAKADLAKAEETYRNTVDVINLDVRSNYLNMREAEKRISTTELAVEQAEEDYRIAHLRYMNGVGTNTDVLDAQVALTTAKTNYLQALYDYNTGKTDLETAIGVPMYFPKKVVVEPAAEKVTK